MAGPVENWFEMWNSASLIQKDYIDHGGTTGESPYRHRQRVNH